MSKMNSYYLSNIEGYQNNGVKMNTQKITTPIEPFLTDNNRKYFKHPINGEIYSMPLDKNTAYDLITGMPLSAFWLCSDWQFETYKANFITGR